jgi:hypothetical protein
MGALSATFLAKMVLDWGWNYWIALALAMVGGALLGALIELGVVRRLFTAPRVILFIATLGVAQLVLVLQGEFPKVTQDQAFPTAIHDSFTVAGIFVDGRQILALAVIPLVTLLLALFLARTLPSSDPSRRNPDAARLAGVRPKRMPTIVWALAEHSPRRPSGSSTARAVGGTQISDALVRRRSSALAAVSSPGMSPRRSPSEVSWTHRRSVVARNVDPTSSGFMNPRSRRPLLFVSIVVALLSPGARRRRRPQTGPSPPASSRSRRTSAT